jgi:hypothetical protein
MDDSLFGVQAERALSVENTSRYNQDSIHFGVSWQSHSNLPKTSSDNTLSL